MRNYKTLQVLAIIFLLAGCSPQQRLNHLIKRHPELSQKDTIAVRNVYGKLKIHLLIYQKSKTVQ